MVGFLECSLQGYTQVGDENAQYAKEGKKDFVFLLSAQAWRPSTYEETLKCEVTRWGYTVSPGRSAYYLVSKLLVLLTFAERRSRREAALSSPRVAITSKTGELSLFPSHGYPEFKTPSKQYENGPITYFEVIAALPRPYHNTSPQ